MPPVRINDMIKRLYLQSTEDGVPSTPTDTLNTPEFCEVVWLLCGDYIEKRFGIFSHYPQLQLKIPKLTCFMLTV